MSLDYFISKGLADSLVTRVNRNFQLCLRSLMDINGTYCGTKKKKKKKWVEGVTSQLTTDGNSVERRLESRTG